MPGVAIAIVKDDRIVFAKGYGVRELNKPAPVDEQTLFAIGSSSKAFTAASIAMLVDQGKLKWDDPATKYLPGFQLFDPYSTRELTVAILLSSSQRSRAWRSALVRLRVRSQRDTASRAISQTVVEFASAFWLPEHHVSRRGPDHSVSHRQDLGRLHPRTHLHSARNEVNEHEYQGICRHRPTSLLRIPRLRTKCRQSAWRNIDNIAPAGSINSNVTGHGPMGATAVR